MLWWEMESWPIKKWGIGEKRLRTPALEELVDRALLSSFCDDSNLLMSVFK